MDLLLPAAQAALVVVFGFAFLTKMRDSGAFRMFRATVGRLLMRSGTVSTVAAAAFTGLEAMTAVFIVFPWTTRFGFACAALLLVSFMAVVVRAVRGGVFGECRCFGGRGAVLGYPLLVRNGFLLAIALCGVVLAHVRVSPLPFVLAALTGAAAAVALIRYWDGAVEAVLDRLRRARARG
ncbi:MULTISPECIES: MauE/DoxX family redox-associated membrane protein [Actinomadura]|uniref:MauE/DoxX family redox-associated membrane protein n=1 Tax=Actinomadura yumaensis TaxID=111807 RepID=A0ABW2CMK8_9ACTN|nr:MauE/DoxX family redox-associated membrane protein [Actinomadura sp. J1-007]MWK37825.1 hypothetical protein [Actinomadura sp. J1-007]